jgi:SSS family solute:Na+ symporter
MAQRILAACSERDAQKGLLLMGALAAIVPTCSFLVGVAVRHVRPDIKPDWAFLHVILTQFPAGMRGVLAAGMMAALLSTADGLLTGSSALLSQDVYLRFLRPNAGERESKRFVRIVEGAALIPGVLLVPLLMKSRTAMQLVQSSVYADLFGVIVGLYLAGLFSRRATGKAAFAASLSGIAVAILLDVTTGLNFAYVGFGSFAYTFLMTLILSRLEPAMSPERLINLTVYTLEDARGPWVGLKAWPGLWKWALIMAGGWFAASGLWEWFVHTR